MVWAIAAVLATGAAQAEVSRAVEVGPVFSQADADRMCPVAAVTTGGTWTGQWWTTVRNEMSVCQIVYQAGTSDVDAGPVWSIADARIKCPIVAFAAGGRWNGQWTTTIPGQMSTCGVETGM